MEETKFCYIARQPGCRCIGVVVVDEPKHPKDTAKTVSDAVKAGLNIERMQIEDFRKLKDQFGCAHELKMKDCRERGMNKEAA